MQSMNTAASVTAALASGDAATAQALRDAWTARQYGDLSDFEIADWAMNVDRVIIEHSMFCACDDECPATEPRRLLAALDHESNRRHRAGISVWRATDRSMERDLAPYGPEWQREQADRLVAS